MRNRVLPMLSLLWVGCASGPQEAPAQLPTLFHDADVDGLTDARDRCPKHAEDGNPPEPLDGCPNLDLDADSVLVPEDECPTIAETRNAFEDQDGCPDVSASFDERAVTLSQDIRFKKDDSALVPSAWAALRAAAALLERHPEIELLEIAAHEPQRRGAWLSLSLTSKRAQAVSRALVSLGVSPDRLQSRGYAHYCWSEQESSSSLVELVVLRVDGTPTQAETGCAAARHAGIGHEPPADPTDTKPTSSKRP